MTHITTTLKRRGNTLYFISHATTVLFVVVTCLYFTTQHTLTTTDSYYKERSQLCKQREKTQVGSSSISRYTHPSLKYQNLNTLTQLGHLFFFFVISDITLTTDLFVQKHGCGSDAETMDGLHQKHVHGGQLDQTTKHTLFCFCFCCQMLFRMFLFCVSFFPLLFMVNKGILRWSVSATSTAAR